LEYRVAELEAMLARVTRERDILIRRHEHPNSGVQQPAQQPSDKAPSGIRLLNARPVPASVSNGRVALPHNHHDPTASVHVQSVAGEEKSLNDMVSELVAANRPDEAIAMLQKFVRQFEGKQGSDMLAEIYSMLAQLMFNTERLEQAIPYARKAYEVHCQIAGPDSSFAAKCLLNLGQLQLKVNQIDSAEANVREALSMYEQMFPESNSIEIARSRHFLPLC